MFGIWVIHVAILASDDGKYIFYAVLVKAAGHQVFKVAGAVEFFAKLQQASVGNLPSSHA